MVRVVLVLLLVTRTAHASDCATEASELRELLVREQGTADTWTFAWRITFTVATAGTLAFGLINPVPSLRDGVLVSSGKAALAAANRWLYPLRVRVPDANADACTDLASLRREVRRVAKKEKQFFWMGHIGGIAVNLGGAAFIWYRTSLGQAALSVALGYPVGLLQNYTMPRNAWHRSRDAGAAWNVTVLPADGGWIAGIGGAF